jgi:hypothetical protein
MNIAEQVAPTRSTLIQASGGMPRLGNKEERGVRRSAFALKDQDGPRPRSQTIMAMAASPMNSSLFVINSHLYALTKEFAAQ